jgi:FkbM family methyltransferase
MLFVKKILRGVRDLTPQCVRSMIYRIGLFFGDPRFPSQFGTFLYLKRWGLHPRNVVDVGAYHGEWARSFRDAFPESDILMVEGQTAKIPQLEKACRELAGRIDFEIAILGANDGEKVKFTEMETGSSVFEENSSFHRNYSERELTTLDRLLSRRDNNRKIDFLKLDVQGYEVQVLKGAEAALTRTEFVLLEASLIPVNTGCPLILEVLNFMDKRGFVLLDFCSQIRRADKALWQTDLLFVSRKSKFVPDNEF